MDRDSECSRGFWHEHSFTHRQSVCEDDRDAECQMRAHGNWHMMKAQAQAISFNIKALAA